MRRTPQEIQDWLVDRVSTLTGTPREEIDPRAPIRRHGLDSLAVVSLAAELETWLGYRFQENPLLKHPTLESLAHYLAEQTRP